MKIFLGEKNLAQYWSYFFTKTSIYSKMMTVILIKCFFISLLNLFIELLRSRLCLFSSYYIFHLFKTNYVERYLHVFQFIFHCLKESEENRAITLQSIETLNFIIIDNTDFERIKVIINGLLQTLKSLKIIEQINEYAFFDFLANAIK